MARVRSIFAGTTDYTGVPLADIVEHLEAWVENTEDSIKQLESLRAEVASAEGRLTSAQAVLSYIDYFVGLFSRYKNDLTRLADELPRGVTLGHIETVHQLVRSAAREDERTVIFKRREIEVALPDESMRGTLDEVYAQTREMLLDYADLDNVEKRLQALVGTAITAAQGENHLDALELKPNLFGVGLNLNYLVPRVLQWWRSRKTPEV